MLTLNFRWFCLSYHLFVLIINFYVGNMVASNKVVLKLFGETFTTLLITLRNETSYNLIRQNHSDWILSRQPLQTAPQNPPAIGLEFTCEIRFALILSGWIKKCLFVGAARRKIPAAINRTDRSPSTLTLFSSLGKPIMGLLWRKVSENLPVCGLLSLLPPQDEFRMQFSLQYVCIFVCHFTINNFV